MIFFKTIFPLSTNNIKIFRDQGAIVSRGDVALIDMRNSPEAVVTLMEIIGKLSEDQDPVVHSTFLFANTVTNAVQMNVYNIVNSYQPLLPQSFADGATPHIQPMMLTAAPQAFMWQFNRN